MPQRSLLAGLAVLAMLTLGLIWGLASEPASGLEATDIPVPTEPLLEPPQPRRSGRPEHRLALLHPDGGPVERALLYLYDEPPGQRWTLWRSTDPGVATSVSPCRLRAFAWGRDAEPPARFEGRTCTLRSKVVHLGAARPGARLDASWSEGMNVDVVEVPLHVHCGLMGTIHGSPESYWVDQFPVFAYRLDDRRRIQRGDVLRLGWLAEPALEEPGTGVFRFHNLPSGIYAVGLRYPDAVVRDVQVVEVYPGATEVDLQVEEPGEKELLRVRCTGERSARIRGVDYSIEWRVNDGMAKGLHRLEPPSVSRGLEESDMIDTRWLPGHRGSAEGWLVATTPAHGQRAVQAHDRLRGKSPDGPLDLDFRSPAELIVELRDADPAAEYEVLLYTERVERFTGSRTKLMHPARIQTLMRTERDPGRRVATLESLARGERAALTIRQLRADDWIRPVEIVEKRLHMESKTRRLTLKAPALLDVSIRWMERHAGRALEGESPQPIGLEVRMPDGRWELLINASASADAPLDLSGLPAGSYRVKRYRTGRQTPFELTSAQGQPMAVWLDLKQ